MLVFSHFPHLVWLLDFSAFDLIIQLFKIPKKEIKGSFRSIFKCQEKEEYSIKKSITQLKLCYPNNEAMMADFWKMIT